jgi:endonuclease/exonuclease/phosphatase family metal-dependent hydrolase
VAVTAAASVMTVVAAVAPAQAAVTMATPAGLTADSVTATTMSLSWKAVTGAGAYRVQLSTSSRMGSPRYLRYTTNHGTLTGLSAKKRYYFRVAVVSASTGSRLSPYTKATYPSAVTKAVAVPAGLRSTAATASSVSMAWNAPEGAAIYQYKRSTSSTFSNASYGRSTTPSASVSGLAAGRTYYFKVRVIRADATPLTSWTPAVTVRTASAPSSPTPDPTPAPDPTPTDGPPDVRVGSYNLFSVSLDETKGERKPWRERRAAIVSNIMSQDVDVLGVQEANPSTYWAPQLVSGKTQPEDLVNGLNAAGGSFAVTNPYSYNCVNPITNYHCDYVYRGASNTDRILYNTKTISVVRTGSVLYDAQVPGSNNDYLAYAVLRTKSTGHEFLFTSTHLEPSSGTVKAAQWRESIAAIKQLRGDLPVVSVGDYNTNKFVTLAEEMFPAQKAAGLGDVLNQEYRVNPARGVRAQHLVNAWVNSYNHFYRNVADFGYSTRRDKIGNGIDQIFATNSLVVKEYEVVTRFNPDTLDVTGTIASDHQMVRATIQIP